MNFKINILKPKKLEWKKTDKEYISDIFGLDRDKFIELTKDISTALFKFSVEDKLTKSDSLKKFVDEDKKYNLDLTNPNDTFILGFAFNIALSRVEKYIKQSPAIIDKLAGDQLEQVQEAIEKITGHKAIIEQIKIPAGQSPEDVIPDILKRKIKKEEDKDKLPN